MDSLSEMATGTEQEESGGLGKWNTEYGSPQSLNAVRIEQNVHVGSNKSNDYSFRKPGFNTDKLTFDERPRDSIERKPASPISGLDEKMKTIEEKIKKYKQENKQFEKGNQKPVDKLLETQMPSLEKLSESINQANVTQISHDINQNYYSLPKDVHTEYFTEKSVATQLQGAEKSLRTSKHQIQPKEENLIQRDSSDIERMEIQSYTGHTPMKQSMGSGSMDQSRKQERSSIQLLQSSTSKFLSPIVYPSQDLAPQPTFGNRFSSSAILNTTESPQDKRKTDEELKRLTSLVEAQRKVITQMQSQLKHERESRQNTAPMTPQQLRSPAGYEAIERNSNISVSLKGQLDLDQMYSSFLERQKQWNNFKFKSNPNPRLSDDIRDIQHIQTSPGQLHNVPSEIIMANKFEHQRKKSKSRKKSVSQREIRVSSSKLSVRSGTASVMSHSKISKNKTKSRSKSQQSKNSRSQVQTRPLARRLSMGSVNCSTISKAKSKKQGNKKSERNTAKKIIKTSSREYQAKKVFIKAVKNDPKGATKLINQLAEMVSNKIDSRPIVPLKHGTKFKSTDKRFKKL